MACLRPSRAPFPRLTPSAAALALFAFGGPAWAQGTPAPAPDGLDLSASMRLRYETIDGQARPGFNESDDLLNLRTILSAQYKTGPVRIAAEIYDSRAWLADRR